MQWSRWFKSWDRVNPMWRPVTHSSTSPFPFIPLVNTLKLNNFRQYSRFTAVDYRYVWTDSNAIQRCAPALWCSGAKMVKIGAITIYGRRRWRRRTRASDPSLAIFPPVKLWVMSESYLAGSFIRVKLPNFHSLGEFQKTRHHNIKNRITDIENWHLVWYFSTEPDPDVALVAVNKTVNMANPRETKSIFIFIFSKAV